MSQGLAPSRKLVFWGGVRPPSRTLTVPPEGEGGLACSGRRVLHSPVRKPPVSRTVVLVVGADLCTGRIVSTGVGAGGRRCMAPMYPRMMHVYDVCESARVQMYMISACTRVVVMHRFVVVMSKCDAMHLACMSMRLMLCPSDSKAAGGRRPPASCF